MTSLPPISNEDILDILREAYPELFARRFLRVVKSVILRISEQETYPGFKLIADMPSDLNGAYCVGVDYRDDELKEIPRLFIPRPSTFYKATPDTEAYIEEVIKKWMESI